MKNVYVSSKFLILSLIIVLVSSSIFTISAQNSKSLKGNKMNAMLANYEKSLNSENHGVRICTIEHIGRYTISDFEDKLIEMLNSEQNVEDKQIIALSLLQLGSLKSMSAIKNSLLLCKDAKYKEYCSTLLNKYVKYDKLKSEYFESLVVYTRIK